MKAFPRSKTRAVRRLAGERKAWTYGTAKGPTENPVRFNRRKSLSSIFEILRVRRMPMRRKRTLARKPMAAMTA